MPPLRLLKVENLLVVSSKDLRMVVNYRVCDHEVQDDANAPDVCLGRRNCCRIINDFRRNEEANSATDLVVKTCATRCVEYLDQSNVLDDELDRLTVEAAYDSDVLWIHVLENDASLVVALQMLDQLVRDLTNFSLGKDVLHVDEIVEVVACSHLGHFRDHVDFVGRLPDRVEQDDQFPRHALHSTHCLVDCLHVLLLAPIELD